MRDVMNITETAMLKPDYLGFIFYKHSPRYAGELNHAVFASLFPCTSSVGVFVNADIDKVVETAEYYKLDVIQLHGDETPEYCVELKTIYNCKIIKAFGIKSGKDLDAANAYEYVCDYFLFDNKTTQYGGSGNKFDHSVLSDYTCKKPFFISGGITLDDAVNIRDNCHKHCVGIDVNSCFEISPGLKDVERIKTLINLFK